MYRKALLVQLYLRMDRLDLADKQVKQMKGMDEDSTLSMLASAWTHLSSVSTVWSGTLEDMRSDDRK